jgi:hypothetical protein
MRRIDPYVFFNPHEPIPAPIPEPPAPDTSLSERFNMAVRMASECAQRGDNIGRLNAINTASQLRRQILALSI